MADMIEVQGGSDADPMEPFAQLWGERDPSSGELGPTPAFGSADGASRAVIRAERV